MRPIPEVVVDEETTLDSGRPEVERIYRLIIGLDVENPAFIIVHAVHRNAVACAQNVNPSDRSEHHEQLGTHRRS